LKLPVLVSEKFCSGAVKGKDVLPLLFVRARSKVLTIISDLHAIVAKRIEPIRPGRKFPRSFNNKTGISSYGYNPYAKVNGIDQLFSKCETLK
jgi:hypothetical protein